jgi:hypothetical protein
MRRSLVAIGVALGSVGGFLFLRRRRSGGSPRAVLHYEDGSSLTLEAGTPHGDRLLDAARDLLAAAR